MIFPYNIFFNEKIKCKIHSNWFSPLDYFSLIVHIAEAKYITNIHT